MIWRARRTRRAVITVDKGNVSIRNANGFDIAYAMLACLKQLEDNGIILHEEAHGYIRSIVAKILALEEKMKAGAQ